MLKKYAFLVSKGAIATHQERVWTKARLKANIDKNNSCISVSSICGFVIKTLKSYLSGLTYCNIHL